MAVVVAHHAISLASAYFFLINSLRRVKGSVDSGGARGGAGGAGDRERELAAEPARLHRALAFMNFHNSDAKSSIITENH